MRSTISKDDRVVFQTADEIRATGADGPRAVTAAQLPPGMYRLRLAVVDAAGRPGTLEMPLGVGLRPMGALQVSDLFVGTAGDRFTPAIEVASGTPLTAILEVYAADPAAFDGVSVGLEVRRTGNDAVAHERARRDRGDGAAGPAHRDREPFRRRRSSRAPTRCRRWCSSTAGPSAR